MKILVTGAGGFIGSNLADHLSLLGHEVHGVDKTFDLYQPKVNMILHDVKNKFYENEKIKNIECDVVLHLAAIPRIKISFEKTQDVFESNINGTLNCLFFAKEKKSKFLFASSSSLYSSPYLNPYTYSKFVGENHCKLFYELYGVPTLITRFFNVYGKNHLRIGRNACLIGILENNIIEKKPTDILGTGDQKRDFTHIDDICSGISLCLEKEWKNETIDLGTGNNHSVKEIVELFNIKNYMNLCPRQGEGCDTLANLKKTQDFIDWKPKVKLKEYIVNFLEDLN
jgi:UDP-glucose 4-epimerase